MTTTRRLFDKKTEREIRRRYEAGETSPALGREYGCSGNHICKVVKAAGGEMRVGGPRPFASPLITEEVARRYREGASLTALSRNLGVSRWIVAQGLKARGVPVRSRQRMQGPGHYRWKGGRTGHTGGYIMVWVDPADPLYGMTDKGTNAALEHRLVMARHLGRLLTKDESVHHIDGNKANNAIENLQLRRRYHGKGHTARCGDCGSVNIIAGTL